VPFVPDTFSRPAENLAIRMTRALWGALLAKLSPAMREEIRYYNPWSGGDDIDP